MEGEVPKKTVKKSEPTHPKYDVMLREAIVAVNDKRGASASAIKNHILGTYPTIDPSALKFRLKKALDKGLESGVILRPKQSEDAKGLSGRFKVDKVKIAAEARAQEKKAKKTSAVAKKKTENKPKSKTEKEKSTKKKPTTTKKSTAKSPSKKITKTAVAKKATPTKSKAKVTKTTPKSKAPAKKPGKAMPKTTPSRAKLTKKRT